MAYRGIPLAPPLGGGGAAGVDSPARGTEREGEGAAVRCAAPRPWWRRREDGGREKLLVSRPLFFFSNVRRQLLIFGVGVAEVDQ